MFTITPTSGPRGTQFVVVGRGFAHFPANVRLTVTDPASNIVLTVLNIPTDVTGALTATLDSTFFRVSGLYTLIATDFVNSAMGTFTVSITSAPPARSL